MFSVINDFFWGAIVCRPLVLCAQDLMRTIHSMLPLWRIDRTQSPQPSYKSYCYDFSSRCAHNFAQEDRVRSLQKLMRGFLFYPGETEDPACVRYGIRPEQMNEVVERVYAWLLPRASPPEPERGEDEAESWQTSPLRFHGFQMTEREIRKLARETVVVSMFRWQWITCWIEMQKSKRPESRDES